MLYICKICIRLDLNQATSVFSYVFVVEVKTVPSITKKHETKQRGQTQILEFSMFAKNRPLPNFNSKNILFAAIF